MDKKYYGYDKSYQLKHHGIKGQRWGVRRYQNPDGSLTSEGQSRYSTGKYEKVRAKAEKKAKALVEKGKNRSLEERKLRANLAANSSTWAVGSHTNDKFSMNLTRGRLTKAGAMKQAAKLQGYYEGQTGKKMSSKSANELRNTIYKQHNTDLKKRIISNVIVSAMSTASIAAYSSTPITGPAGLAVGLAGMAATYGKYYKDVLDSNARLNEALSKSSHLTYDDKKSGKKSKKIRGLG